MQVIATLVRRSRLVDLMTFDKGKEMNECPLHSECKKKQQHRDLIVMVA